MVILHWVNTYCKDSEYMLKTDDDIFLDVVQIIHLLRYIWIMKYERFVIGRPRISNKVERDPSSKWFVSNETFPEKKFYYTHMAGACYILPTPLVPQLCQIATKTPMIQVEDAYVTGVLAVQIPGLKYFQYGQRIMEKSRPSSSKFACKALACHTETAEIITIQWCDRMKKTARRKIERRILKNTMAIRRARSLCFPRNLTVNLNNMAS